MHCYYGDIVKCGPLLKRKKERNNRAVENISKSRQTYIENNIFHLSHGIKNIP